MSDFCQLLFFFQHHFSIHLSSFILRQIPLPLFSLSLSLPYLSPSVSIMSLIPHFVYLPPLSVPLSLLAQPANSLSMSVGLFSSLFQLVGFLTLSIFPLSVIKFVLYTFMKTFLSADMLFSLCLCVLICLCLCLSVCLSVCLPCYSSVNLPIHTSVSVSDVCFLLGIIITANLTFFSNFFSLLIHSLSLLYLSSLSFALPLSSAYILLPFCL